MSSHFTPTPSELALVNQIFAQADTQKIGILTGDVAVRIFGGAKLAPSVLGEIWSIADEDNNGFLTRKGVAIAVRLIGWAQKGEKVSQALLGKSGPLATIDGVHASLVPQGTGTSIPKSPPPGLPLLTPQDKAKFARLFQSCGPVNGLLSGEKARDVFVKSKLPVDKLSQIWSLADTQDRGALDLTDFTIAMYLIQATMSNQLSFIPTSLPPGLYEQAGGAAIVAHATGSSGHPTSPATSSSFPANTKRLPVQTNVTGQPNLVPTLPSRRPAPVAQTPALPPFPSVVPQATVPWDVTPVEKASADRFFDSLDSHKRGYIEGDVAVPFMLQSKLPEEVLAQVWDLADINNDGRLTRDGFAVGMHLIQSKLSGKEIPNVLPPTLLPPSMRSNGSASPFTAVPPPPPTDAIRDLLWDDSPPTSTVNTQHQHNVLQPQTSGIAPPTTFSSVTHAPPVLEDPFTTATHSSFHKDLLGDDDDTHPPPPSHDRSAEIGNLQNQVTSTNRSLQNVKAEREALETTLANQAAQLSSLETQLASAKASFETETALLGSLKERHTGQNAEIQKVREELIRSESDLSATRVEKAEIEGSFLRDKEEVRDLNRRMAEVTTQITAAKQEVERTKKDAKQQKGLLAIARKQLATKESEKAKVDQELAEAQEDLANTVEEREEAEAQAEAREALTSPQLLPVPRGTKSPADSLSFAAAHPLPITPDITGSGPLSPSGGKSNNPFERRLVSSGEQTPRSQSPFSSFPTTSIPPPPGLTPPSVRVTTLEDPFGTSQVFDSAPQPSSGAAPDNDTTDVAASTPKVKAMLGGFGEIVSSPSDDEFFSTPPNSTTPVNLSGEATPQFPSLDSVAVHFPALDDIPTGQGDSKENETDLSTDLHDLDVNETDSDSDSDEEERKEETWRDQESRLSEVPPTKNESTPPIAPATFDDIFGASDDAPVVTAPEVAPQTDNVLPGSAALDAFGVPLTKPVAASEDGQDSGFTLINAPAASKGSSFDEAFGKTSSSGPPQTASNFSFESAFEDSFDFGVSSGTAVQFPTTSSDAPPANGNTTTKQTEAATANDTQDVFPLPMNGGPSTAVQTAPVQAPVSLNDTFPSRSWFVGSSAPQPEKTVAGQPAPGSISFEEAFGSSAPQPEKTVADQPVPGSISFEEAFGGLDSSQALKLDESFSSRASNVFTTPVSLSHSDAGKQYSMSPPASPQGSTTSPRVTSPVRTSSPQARTTSPPPRVVSPKGQRPSNVPSKEVVQEKPAPPPRHSKLSIRLFGKRKKQDTLPAMPASHSGQQLARVEEPGVLTPAVDDDVEAVKQLAAMGFTRHQAVAALEAHDYDLPRALNSLLGA